MRRTGAKHLSRFHHLGMVLVVLGMVQSLAPPYFRPVRSSLRLLGRLSVALISLADTDPTDRLVWTAPPLATGPGQDSESGQESHDTEDLAEPFTWSEAIPERRSVQGSLTAASLASTLKPDRAAERTRSALQRSRTLPILAADAATATTRLCRLTC